jgi:hypothetical protein
VAYVGIIVDGRAAYVDPGLAWLDGPEVGKRAGEGVVELQSHGKPYGCLRRSPDLINTWNLWREIITQWVCQETEREGYQLVHIDIRNKRS